MVLSCFGLKKKGKWGLNTRNLCIINYYLKRPAMKGSKIKKYNNVLSYVYPHVHFLPSSSIII